MTLPPAQLGELASALAAAVLKGLAAGEGIPTININITVRLETLGAELKTPERVPPGRSAAADLDAGGGHEREAAGDQAAEPPNSRPAPPEPVKKPATAGSAPRPKAAKPGRTRPSSPGGGGERAPVKPDLTDELRERVRAILDTLGCEAETAIRKRGVDLGASHFTIHQFVNGAQPKQRTLRKIQMALERLELGGGVAALAPVEKLPTKFPPVTGNNLVRPSIPPRCGKTT